MHANNFFPLACAKIIHSNPTLIKLACVTSFLRLTETREYQVCPYFHIYDVIYNFFQYIGFQLDKFFFYYFYGFFLYTMIYYKNAGY